MTNTQKPEALHQPTQQDVTEARRAAIAALLPHTLPTDAPGAWIRKAVEAEQARDSMMNVLDEAESNAQVEIERIGRLAAALGTDELGWPRDHGNAWLEGLNTLTKLRATINAAEKELVALARGEGASWTDIGIGLGITRQSAQQRFS